MESSILLFRNSIMSGVSTPTGTEVIPLGVTMLHKRIEANESQVCVDGLVLISKNFQRKIVNIFLPIIFSICFGCSKETSHGDGSFEYP